MQKTTFKIPQMDCPSEESLIQMKLQSIRSIEHLEFDIPSRILHVYHIGNLEQIEKALQELKLGAEKVRSEHSDATFSSQNNQQKRLLWTVLGINFSFFLIEMSTGLISKSMGLVADSLDMLADAFVYGLSLLAVGGSLAKKKKVAQIAGYFQMSLALLGFVEVVRRFFGIVQMPDFQTMIIVSLLALIANIACLYLLQKSKSKEAHMQASMIFTSNDVIINSGVILAGLLVNWLNSNLPDLIIGSIVFALVLQGASRILKLAK